MSRLLVVRSSRRAPLTAASSLVRGLLGRLAPLAVVALLGCVPDKSDSLGIGGDPPAEDDGDETPDSELAGDEPAVALATECEQRFSCDCGYDRFADVAACEEFYLVEWAGIEAKAAAAGLTADLECYLQSMPYATYTCDSWSEYYEEQGSQTCSSCQYAYGERQVGESCQDFGGAVGDCAQGLLCYPTGEGTTTECIDPCSQAAEGESCNYQVCETGLACDWIDMRCRPAGGAGETCADGVCDDGLICDWLTNTCTQGAAVGESCEDQPCAAGLGCDEGFVCGPLAGPGESCTSLPCAAGLMCRWDDATCAALGQVGDSCLGLDCEPGLVCDAAALCAAPAGPGESCLEQPCVEGLLCDAETSTCTTPPGLGEPCSDYCTEGLLCNWDVQPAVCAALPGAGEPCVVGQCEFNFVCDGETLHCVPEPAIVCGL
jgi:hypothetical protein